MGLTFANSPLRARHCTENLMLLFSFTPYQIANIIPILGLRKLKLREVTQIA